jgi:hypothetical protein
MGTLAPTVCRDCGAPVTHTGPHQHRCRRCAQLTNRGRVSGYYYPAELGAPVPRGIGCLVIAVGVPFADCVREIRVEPGRLVFEYDGGEAS